MYVFRIGVEKLLGFAAGSEAPVPPMPSSVMMYGFSLASLLARYREVSNLDLDITVVYSEKIGNIGVGESTLLSVNDLFHFLGLKDEDWMKQCNATYKTSISFENFYKKGTSFQYPFGNPAFMPDQFRSQKWFEMKDHYPEIFTPDTYARYIFPHTRLNETNKLTDIQETLW